MTLNIIPSKPGKTSPKRARSVPRRVSGLEVGMHWDPIKLLSIYHQKPSKTRPKRTQSVPRRVSGSEVGPGRGWACVATTQLPDAPAELASTPPETLARPHQSTKRCLASHLPASFQACEIGPQLHLPSLWSGSMCAEIERAGHGSTCTGLPFGDVSA